jgi:hypothetical protein
MLEIMQNMPDSVVAIRASGQVTGKDYEDVLIPAVESGLKRYEKIRVLYQLDRDFSGFTAGALFDDARLGLHHRRAFEKITIVTDVDWIAKSVHFFSLFVPCPVRIFGNHHISIAKVRLLE